MADGAGQIAEMLMSRTDKTRPYWVKKKDHEIKRPRMAEGEWYLEYYTYEWWLGEMRCGCPFCSDTAGRKERARKDRYQGRREARNWED